MGSHISRKIKITPYEQMKELKRGGAELLPEDELFKKIEISYQTDTPLIVKFGADPSRPDIHLGHTVVINKMKVLQEFGHDIHFLIGDFTGQIGDPTGRKKARPQLTAEEVMINAKTYQEQIFKILDVDKTKIVYNSSWHNQIRLDSFLKILVSTTLVQLLSREDFSDRFKSEQPIFMHEFLYPILQGYDSVAMKADIEMGGTDQKFNLLMGRHLQKSHNMSPQALIIMPILEGLDGVNKMSKSLDNTITLTDSAKDMFGKIMSISDPLMLRYYELVSTLSVDEIDQIQAHLKSGQIHPMEVKKRLAEEIVDRYHGPGIGARERKRFDDFFSKNSSDQDLPLLNVKVNELGRLNWVSLIVEQGFTQSKSEARRLLVQKAVKLDGEVVTDEWFTPENGIEYVFRVGKLHKIKLIASF